MQTVFGHDCGEAPLAAISRTFDLEQRRLTHETLFVPCSGSSRIVGGRGRAVHTRSERGPSPDQCIHAGYDSLGTGTAGREARREIRRTGSRPDSDKGRIHGLVEEARWFPNIYTLASEH